jgi:acylphosphatase
VTRLRLVLRGRVQGVGFRDTVADIARRHQVAGSVRNLRDGTLEIDAEGGIVAVEAFLGDVLREPPPLARIDAVVKETLEPLGAVGFRRAPTA